MLCVLDHWIFRSYVTAFLPDLAGSMLDLLEPESLCGATSGLSECMCTGAWLILVALDMSVCDIAILDAIVRST